MFGAPREIGAGNLPEEEDDRQSLFH